MEIFEKSTKQDWDSEKLCVSLAQLSATRPTNMRTMRVFLAALSLTACLHLEAQTRWNDYHAADGKVLYQGQYLPDADAESFEELGFGYARDRYNVYYLGEVLEFVDPSCFKVDARFTRHHKIGAAARTPVPRTAHSENQGKASALASPQGEGKGLDIEGWLGLGPSEAGEYLVKDGIVTYEGHAVKGADAASFEPLKAGYARDRRHGYYKGTVISNAIGGKHFSYSGDDYATDGLHTYFKGKEVDRN